MLFAAAVCADVRRVLVIAAALAAPRAALAADVQPDASALIAKAVEAFGGPAAVDAVGALELKGRGTRRIQADDVPVATVTRYFFPDRYYQELVLPMGTMKTILGPKAAFIVAGEGSLPLPDAERQSMMKLMQRNVVAVLKARRQPGFAATVVGTDTVEGTAVQLVQVTRDGDALVLAIDPASGQVRQTRYESSGGLAPAGKLVVTYSDYRPSGALPPGTIRYPFRAAGVMSGQPAFTQTLETVVVNPKLDEALFEAPAPHAMFPGVEDLPLPSPPPTLLPRPSPSPTPMPRE